MLEKDWRDFPLRYSQLGIEKEYTLKKIGRELYTAPKIFIDLKQGEYSEENGKIRCKASFFVRDIHYDENRQIDRLVIIDKSGNERYRFGQATGRPSAPTNPESSKPSKPECDKETWWKLVRMDVEGKRSKKGLTGYEYLLNKYRTDEATLTKFADDVKKARDKRATQDFLALDESMQNPNFR